VSAGIIQRLSALAGALAAAVAVGAEPGAAEGAVTGHAVLHLRWTARENQPGQQILFDPATNRFALGDYLRPMEDDRAPSFFLAGGLQWRWLEDRLRLRLAFDTGELRRRRYPQLVLACYSATTGTGLAVAGRGQCSLPIYLAELESTDRDKPELTANGRPFKEELEQTLLLRELYLSWSFGQAQMATVGLGRRRFTVGDGFIYDDYGSGVDATVDVGAVGPQWDLGAAIFLPTRDRPARAGTLSPMIALRGDFLPSLFEHAGGFLAFYQDRTDSVAELFRSAHLEASVMRVRAAQPGTAGFAREQLRLAGALVDLGLSGRANLTWVGTSGSISPGRSQLLGWTGALLLGRAELRYEIPGEAPVDYRVPISGKMAQLRYKLDLHPAIAAGVSFLYLSGDLPPEEKRRRGERQRYGGFLGIAPYVTATNLFFNGGLSESFAARQATAPGVNGRGVIAPGLSLTWDPTTWLGAELKGAYLIADEVGPFGGRQYGPEVDLTVSSSFVDWMVLAAEGDVLLPGDFFGGGKPVFKFVLGVDLIHL
jgi:hypothetical protein